MNIQMYDFSITKGFPFANSKGFRTHIKLIVIQVMKILKANNSQINVIQGD